MPGANGHNPSHTPYISTLGERRPQASTKSRKKKPFQWNDYVHELKPLEGKKQKNLEQCSRVGHCRLLQE
jgi:hypothetical protein